MDRKKELVNEYKQRKRQGGVYRITNTVNGKYLLGNAADLKGAQNRFDFFVGADSGVPLKLQRDWEEFGGKAFAFEVLEEIEMKQDQSEAEFADDLKTLEELWREKLDSSCEY